ncbi:extracellular solute-binding protein [Brachybacterium sp. GCM10030252]|uniref:ABC transporter substrate-binding protein n=1 Tax=Brachybacterium sp. GCM10030252 TaxID=3273380 RepID=UPI003615CDC5
MTTLPRRALLGTFAAAATAAGLAGCNPNQGGGSSQDLRISWYGGQPVHEGMEGALDAFSQDHPDLQMTTEKAPFDDYWDKLATQVAGGEGPDLIRMSMSWFLEYAERGALLDLESYAGDAIDLTALDEEAGESGRTDDGLFGVGQSSITQATFRNPQLAAEYGLDLPETWAWTDFTEFCREFAETAGPGKYGATDSGGDMQLFGVWARQHGTDLFDGQDLAVEADVIEEWWAMWQELRDDGAVPPPEVTLESSGFEQSQFATLNAVITSGWVQQATFYQPVMPDHPLEVTDVPGLTAGALDGQFLKALDLWCVLSSAKNPDGAAELIDFLLNEPAAATSIGVTLGVPPSQAARDALELPDDSAEGKAIAYVESVRGRTGPPPAPWPTGYGALQGSEFPRFNEAVAFGSSTPAQAAAEFHEFARTALNG